MATYDVNLLIAGELVPGKGAQITVDNPATEETLATFDGASEDQVDAAIEAARRAFDSGVWSDPELRKDRLQRIADLLEKHEDELNKIIISEVGTPISLSTYLQAREPVAVFRSFADYAVRDWTDYLGVKDGPLRSDAIIRRLPTGVVSAIAAYNYPVLFAAAKLGAAFAAGCTAVLTPSPQAPLGILFLARLLQEADLPPGVVNVVAGGVDVAQRMTTHPDVDKVSFTGSASVGRQIMAQAAPGLKRLVLELGGKSPSIILPDVDAPSIADQVHARYARNAGQGCSSPTRILVHKSQIDDFIDASKPVLAEMKVGDPWDPSTVAGPLITSRHRERVEGFVDRAVADGGSIVAGGGRPDIERGWFMNAALLAGLDNSAEICREELFGPVGVVLPYNTIDEAIELANDSQYGLAATIYGDADTAKEISPRLRVGTVMVNGWIGRPDQSSGGFKASGIGREMGAQGVLEFLEGQYVAWPEPAEGP
ncbi:aldehyde dehydrogenase family protein [Rhodococcus koreensis]|uniref:aldehyde dehydrogenase family protein n=1 Tax=Rhodococcus koreensis TaxID=99653 RepID=UPI0036D8A847